MARPSLLLTEIKLVHEKYLNVVKQIDLPAYRAGAVASDLLISISGDLTVDYAPFDHIERGAELVIVGLTPGRQQAANALETLASELTKGTPEKLALERAKRTASFSGPMRTNLLAMLDAIGVPALYGRERSEEFFSDAKSRVHFTSALRYPTYLGGKNYSGTPDPLKHPMLRKMIDTYLAEEALALPDAMWVPLGQHAEAALLHLARDGRLARANILAGLPHPSGANAERIAYFLGRKEASALSAKTNAEKIDQAKGTLIRQVQGRKP